MQAVFDSELWLWDARRSDAWTFVSLPAGESEEIRDLAGGLRRGFGSLRVRATIGSSTWMTSIFPGQAGYVLPLRSDRRSSAGDPDRGARSVVVMPSAKPAGLAWFDVAGASAPNDEVAGQARDADDDVITAGREPAGHPGWTASLIWLLIIAETAALAGTAALALHYRTEVSKLRHGTPAAAGRPAAPTLPRLTSVALRLPAGGNVTGTVMITAAITPGAVRAQFTVSAGITGGRPGVVYDLTGNDCSATAPLPDHVWATGLTSADGRAELTGYAWTGAVTDEYWLTLSPSSGSPPPGLHGRFADGTAAPFPGGQAPCAALP